MMRKLRNILLTLLLLAIVALTAASFFMLNHALQPDNNKGRDTEGSYAYMFQTYPFLRPWVDSLRRAGALRDTFITADDGTRLHALYARAKRPTRRTAVIVHGYKDCAVRMLMIGYLYHHDLGFNILLPDLYGAGQSGGDYIRMGWLDRYDVIRWTSVADELFGPEATIAVHGISMGAATTSLPRSCARSMACPRCPYSTPPACSAARVTGGTSSRPRRWRKWPPRSCPSSLSTARRTTMYPPKWFTPSTKPNAAATVSCGSPPGQATPSLITITAPNTPPASAPSSGGICEPDSRYTFLIL